MGYGDPPSRASPVIAKHEFQYPLMTATNL